MTSEAHGPQTRVNLFTKMNRIYNQRRYVYAINLVKDFVDSLIYVETVRVLY